MGVFSFTACDLELRSWSVLVHESTEDGLVNHLAGQRSRPPPPLGNGVAKRSASLRDTGRSRAWHCVRALRMPKTPSMQVNGLRMLMLAARESIFSVGSELAGVAQNR